MVSHHRSQNPSSREGTFKILQIPSSLVVLRSSKSNCFTTEHHKPIVSKTHSASQLGGVPFIFRGFVQQHQADMVAPNTQVSPLKHHWKGSNTLTSFRNYSRIQSEVQREGCEVHKENLLSLSLSKNGKHFEAGEKTDTMATSGPRVGHLHVQDASGKHFEAGEKAGTMATSVGHMCVQVASAKTGSPGALSMEIDPFLHGLNAQEHGHDTYHMDMRVSHGINCLAAPGTAEKPSRIAAFASSPSVQSLAPGEEAINAYNLYAEMFPRACTPVSTCTPTSDMHGEQEFCPSKPLIAENVEVVQYLPDVNSVKDDQEDKVKRLKYTSTMENKSMLLGMQNSKQGNTSCCVVDGSSTRAVMGEVCTFKCASKIDNCTVMKAMPQHSTNDFNAGFMSCISSVNAHSPYGTSLVAELCSALPAVGLKLFTTSAHVQMPKALLTFSEGEPSLPQQASNRLQKTPMHENSCSDADWGKFLALSATPITNDMETSIARVLPFQQRFKQLQAFLKQCDETNQNECMQALWSLSAAARSGHAVELETRAIRLSLEEGKEIKRMRLLNVLGKFSDRSLDDAGATPHGPRLPAPGGAAKIKNVP